MLRQRQRTDHAVGEANPGGAAETAGRERSSQQQQPWATLTEVAVVATLAALCYANATEVPTPSLTESSLPPVGWHLAATAMRGSDWSTSVQLCIELVYCLGCC